MDKITFSVTEAAQTLGLSPRYVRELISGGRLPIARLGARVLIRRADLEQLINEAVTPYIPAAIGRGATKRGR